MAGDQLWERDVLSFSLKSRDGGRQLEQGELRQSVRRDLYVWQVVCPPRHHTLEASPLRARIRHQCVCPGVLLGKFAEFTEHPRGTRPRRARGGYPNTGATGGERAGFSICHGIFLWHLKGPGTPGDWSHISNWLSNFDLSPCSF